VRRIALIAAALAVLSGCGGEAKKDTFTAGEWAARAEAACKRATDAIAERGWPRDLEELRSLASDAADDARAAIDEIDRLPVPADRADEVHAFVTGLRDLEPKIDGRRLGAASRSARVRHAQADSKDRQRAPRAGGGRAGASAHRPGEQAHEG
jgi:hypothetical protein